MCDKTSSPREVPQRVSDRKENTLVELAPDDSFNTLDVDAFDIDLLAPIDLQVDSQSSMEGYRDLFGALIPYDKSGSSSTKKPQQNFIPTPNISFDGPQEDRITVEQCYKYVDSALKAKGESLSKRIDYSLLDDSNDFSGFFTPPKSQKTIKNPDTIFVGYSNILFNLLNSQDNPYLDEEELDEQNVPMSIKGLRKYIMPNGVETKTPSELDNDLTEIENELKLNSRVRQRFRRLLLNNSPGVQETIACSGLTKNEQGTSNEQQHK